MQSNLGNPETFNSIFSSSFIQLQLQFWSTFCLKNGFWATEVSNVAHFSEPAANANVNALDSQVIYSSGDLSHTERRRSLPKKDDVLDFNTGNSAKKVHVWG